MLSKEVQKYIAAAKGLPFFYAVGDSGYAETLNELKQAGLDIVRISDFCFRDDKFPSIDDLVDHFRTLDVDYRDNRYVVIGLGEYLALKGRQMIETELSRLKNTTLGTARVVLLLRGVSSFISDMVEDDRRLAAQQRVTIAEDPSSAFSVTIVPAEADMVPNVGIKHLLKALENGKTGDLLVSTKLSLQDAVVRVSTLSDMHTILKKTVSGFDFPSESGTEEQWSHLLKDVRKHHNSLAETFQAFYIDDGIFNSLYAAIAGVEYKNWLAFLYCKMRSDCIDNPYLRVVTEKTTDFVEFKKNILTYIINIPHTDPDYRRMYDARKRLIKEFPDEELAAFLKENEVYPEESIYRLTDTTSLERKTIIKWIVRYGISDVLEYVYPALYDYMKKYSFQDCVLSKELTEYMEAYKRQKVTNRIETEFIALVERYAKQYLYAQLPTRDSAIQSIPDKKNTYLYWIDALGIEYLSYIAALARKKGLSIHVDITRADLPTITKVNKGFFETWEGGRKHKEERLDEIKHKEKGGFYFTADPDPIHIPAELSIIEQAVGTAATELAMHKCRRFVIASDHGASRLAVLHKQDIPYDTDTKGEHSGRCCKSFEGCDLPFSIEENGYIVLSDYGRFRGSRAANVEVHGGASLEEAVVPVITLTLRKAVDIQVKLMAEEVFLDKNKNVTVTIYISDTDSAHTSIRVNDIQYQGSTDNGTHFTFTLSGLTSGKRYIAEIYDAEDLIGTTEFTVRSKKGSTNESFDSLFDM